MEVPLPSLQLKIYERIPFPDLAVIILPLQRPYDVGWEDSSWCCNFGFLYVWFFGWYLISLQVVFPHKKLSFRIIDTVRNLLELSLFVFDLVLNSFLKLYAMSTSVSICLFRIYDGSWYYLSFFSYLLLNFPQAKQTLVQSLKNMNDNNAWQLRQLTR